MWVRKVQKGSSEGKFRSKTMASRARRHQSMARLKKFSASVSGLDTLFIREDTLLSNYLTSQRISSSDCVIINRRNLIVKYGFYSTPERTSKLSLVGPIDPLFSGFQCEKYEFWNKSSDFQICLVWPPTSRMTKSGRLHQGGNFSGTFWNCSELIRIERMLSTKITQNSSTIIVGLTKKSTWLEPIFC